MNKKLLLIAIGVMGLFVAVPLILFFPTNSPTNTQINPEQFQNPDLNPGTIFDNTEFLEVIEPTNVKQSLTPPSNVFIQPIIIEKITEIQKCEYYYCFVGKIITPNSNIPKKENENILITMDCEIELFGQIELRGYYQNDTYYVSCENISIFDPEINLE